LAVVAERRYPTGMRRPRAVLLGATLAIAAVTTLAPHLARARAEADSDYTKTQTYNGALRYVRVDLGYEVVEKDPDAGYILFRYEPPGRRNNPTNGSIEVIETPERVKLVVQLPQMPTYHETTLRDGLMKKLRAEYGEPPKKPAPAPKKPSPDGGADSGTTGS
jgi:hypothetical protein